MNLQCVIIGLGLIFLSSCVAHEELINFNEQTIPYGEQEFIDNSIDLKIQPNDLLRITVSASDPLAAAPFNLDGVGIAGGGGMQQINQSTLELFRGYMVDAAGNVALPLLGPLKVEGLTIEQLTQRISTDLTAYLRDPVVTARFLNFKVTVLGEVSAPGVVSLSNSRVTVLDAIGFAGDLTDYADRNEVQVIREFEGKREYALLNLRRKDIFNSEFFYLKQNDVIYVRPLRAKVATVADPGQRVVAYGSAFLSVITLIIALVVD